MFEMENGVDHPLGARLDETGCHFCVWAPQSDKVELCLFDEEEQELARLPCPVGAASTGSATCAASRPVSATVGYRVHGSPQEGPVVRPGQAADRPLCQGAQPSHPLGRRPLRGDSAAMVGKSVVVDDAFDWQGVGKPGIPPERVVLYETHVKGFTRQHPGIPKALQGTYLGISHPLMIEHLQGLG